MKVYEGLSIRFARWLTAAGEIEEIADAIDDAAMKAETDAEYEALGDLRYCAGAALDGWSRADQLFTEATVQLAHRHAEEAQGS